MDTKNLFNKLGITRLSSQTSPRQKKVKLSSIERTMSKIRGLPYYIAAPGNQSHCQFIFPITGTIFVESIEGCIDIYSLHEQDIIALANNDSGQDQLNYVKPAMRLKIVNGEANLFPLDTHLHDSDITKGLDALKRIHRFIKYNSFSEEIPLSGLILLEEHFDVLAMLKNHTNFVSCKRTNSLIYELDKDSSINIRHNSLGTIDNNLNYLFSETDDEDVVVVYPITKNKALNTLPWEKCVIQYYKTPGISGLEIIFYKEGQISHSLKYDKALDFIKEELLGLDIKSELSTMKPS